MDGGAWWATVHGVAELDATEQLHSLTQHIPTILSFFFFFRFFFFECGTFFKVLIEFVTILFLFSVLVFWPGGMWDLRSLTRDQTGTP